MAPPKSHQVIEHRRTNRASQHGQGYHRCSGRTLRAAHGYRSCYLKNTRKGTSNVENRKPLSASIGPKSRPRHVLPDHHRSILHGTGVSEQVSHLMPFPQNKTSQNIELTRIRFPFLTAAPSPPHELSTPTPATAPCLAAAG